MASEAVIRTGLTISKDNLRYNALPAGFSADVATAKGPVPGAVSVATAGTVLDLGELTTPSLCRLMNLDTTNFVEVGIREPSSGFFYPLLELLPGESYVFRLSRNLLEEYTGAGTGTSAPTNEFYAKANTAAVVLLVEAFEK